MLIRYEIGSNMRVAGVKQCFSLDVSCQRPPMRCISSRVPLHSLYTQASTDALQNVNPIEITIGIASIALMQNLLSYAVTVAVRTGNEP
jgi:hypothetical protein